MKQVPESPAKDDVAASSAAPAGDSAAHDSSYDQSQSAAEDARAIEGLAATLVSPAEGRAFDPDHAGVFSSTETSSAPDPGLRHRAVIGSYWAMIGFVALNVMRLGGNLIVTRLLVPEDYGVAQLVAIFMQGLQMLSDLGIGPAIIQHRRGDDDAFLNTAFTVQVVRGLGLTAVACALAWPFAIFYEAPQLRYLLPAAAVSVLLQGFNSTNLFRLARHILQKRLVLLEVSAQAVSIAGMITWAMISPTVWALVAPGAAGALVTLVGSHLLLRDRRDRFAYDNQAAQELVNFSRWIFVSTLLAYLTVTADRLVFGKLIPKDQLGVYGIGLMLAMLPLQLINKLSHAIAFPALSRISDRGEGHEAFERAVLRTRRPLLAIGGLMSAGLIACGYELIRVMYDPRYAEAGWILQLLAVGVWLQILGGANGAILLARGRTRDLALAQFVKLVSLLAGIGLGWWLGGFFGAVVGVAVSEISGYLASMAPVRKERVRTLGLDLRYSGLVALTGGIGWLISASGAPHLGDNYMRPRFAGLLVIAVIGLLVTLAWTPALLRVRRTLQAGA